MWSASPGFCEAQWPGDWALVLVALVKFAGGGFREVEAMTASEARHWHNAANELETIIAAEIKASS